MALGTDNFDSYSTGTLDTNNGGSGWGGAWTAGTGGSSFLVESLVSQSSPNGVTIVSDSGDHWISRLFASTQTKGVQSIYVQLNATNGEADVELANGVTSATQTCYLRFGTDNKVIIFSSNFASTTQVAASYNANQWYQVEIDFDCGLNQYRARLDGGTWSSFAALNFADASVDRIAFHDGGNTTGKTRYYDTIAESTPATGTPLPRKALLGVGI